MSIRTVNYGKLSGSYALDFFLRLYEILTSAKMRQRSFYKFRRMPVLEHYWYRRFYPFPWISRNEMHFIKMYRAAILLLVAISVTYIYCIVGHIFFTTYQGPPLKPSPLRCPIVWNQYPLCSPILRPVSISIMLPFFSPRCRRMKSL